MSAILIPTITIIPTSGAAMHGGRNRRSLLMILCMATTTGIFLKKRKNDVTWSIATIHIIITRSRGTALDPLAYEFFEEKESTLAV